MKICPTCQTKYTDTTLKFCLQDGTELIGETSGSGSHPTVSFEESETLVSGSKPEQISFDLSDSGKDNWQESQVTRVATLPAEPGNSKTVIAVLATALVMFLLFGIIGVGTYLYLSGGNSGVGNNNGVSDNQNTNQTTDKPNIGSTNASNSNVKPPNTETTPTKTEKPTPTKEPTPEVDPEKAKKDIADRIYTWKSGAEAINLNAYMNNYAERIDYYRKNGASKSFVRNDKQRAFSKYDSIKVQISNITIKPASDGRTAVAVIDKEWDFSGPANKSSGKVRQQLKFKKSGEVWLITSEKDLKVYYVNK